MAYSIVSYFGDGSTNSFVVPFQFLDRSHITVTVAGDPVSFVWGSDTIVSVEPAPNGIVEIRRRTPKDNPPVNFSDGSVLKEKELDLLAIFSMYCAQESQDLAEEVLSQIAFGTELAKVYLGTRTVNPSTRTAGDPLILGDLYFNSTFKTMRVYTGLLWQDIGITVPGILNKPATPILATAGQTSVPVIGGYDVNGIVVFLNGTMVAPPDIVTTSGTNIVFNTPLALNDEVSWLAFGVFQVANVWTKKELLAADGAAKIGYGTGTVKDALDGASGGNNNVLKLGAKGNGIADDTAAIQACLNKPGWTYIPKGTYKITSQIIVGPSCAGIYGDGGFLSVIDKRFNGNAILCDTNGAALRDFGIAGNGGAFTGGGIVPRGFNILIHHLRVAGTADSPIMVAGAVGSTALAATYLRVDSCFLQPFNVNTTYGVRSITPDDPTNPTCRVFSNLSGGCPLVDFSGMNYAILKDSLGTSVAFDIKSSKIVMSGNRLTSAAASITIKGLDHVIDGNFWGFGPGYGLTIDPGCADVYFGPSNLITSGGQFLVPVNQNLPVGAANPNNVSTQLVPYTFGWTATSVAPTLGNGTSYAYFKQEGRMVHATLGLTAGSGTNVGDGIWAWALPFKAFVPTLGSALVRSSDGHFYAGVAEVQGGSSFCTIYLSHPIGQLGTTSLLFGSGAVIEVSISYLIAIV